jgi:O-methyltransferase
LPSVVSLIKMLNSFSFLCGLIILLCLVHQQSLLAAAMEMIEEKGDSYHIFHPYQEYKDKPKLISPPSEWIESYLDFFHYIDPKTKNAADFGSPRTRAEDAYLTMLKNFLLGYSFQGVEKAINGATGQSKMPIVEMNLERRKNGQDWPWLGFSMAGEKRLDSARAMLTELKENRVEGDFMETGVWRGGTSVFARGVLSILGDEHTRTFVCDSFAGLPPSLKILDPSNWDNTPYLEVSTDEVAKNFQRVSLLSPQVVFVKGFFNNTMPPLKKYVQKLSILRLDGDMYQSTADVLYHFYENVAIGGYIIIDDWRLDAKKACWDFFRHHKFLPNIQRPDPVSAFWKKTIEIDVRKDLYDRGHGKKIRWKKGRKVKFNSKEM